MSNADPLETSAVEETVASELEPIPETLAGDVASLTTTPSSVLPNKIKSIQVTFSKAIRDVRGRVMPHGTATATFGDGNTVSVPVTGGAHVPTYGITDAVTNYPVTRIEGSGYKNFKKQPMPYGVFYNRGEALHIGRLDLISHGCVHVADWDNMQKINHGAVIGRTKVTVTYGPGVLDKVWSQRL